MPMPDANAPAQYTELTATQIHALAASARSFDDIADEYGEEVAIQVGIARDPDTHELTAEEMAQLRPAQPRRRGKQKAPVKVAVHLRLDADVVEHLRAGGKGWQTRLNAMLRKMLIG